MFQLDFRDHRPLYEQIKEKMKALMISGALKANDKIPSVRELAQSLTINPNTIQKAYHDLEAEGFIYSIRGKGSFIAPLEGTVHEPRQQELLLAFEKLAAELMYLNVPGDVLSGIVENTYKKRRPEDDRNQKSE